MATEQKKEKHEDFGKAQYYRPLLLVILLLLLVIIGLLVKPPVPPLPALLPSKDPHMHAGPEKVRSATGTVIAYKYNPHLDVNAVQIRTPTAGIITIEFRPHTAEATMEIGPVGQQVYVTYSLHPNDEVIGYQLVSIENKQSSSRQVLKDLPPPPDIPNHQTRNFRLDRPILITDIYGGIVALRKGNMLFHFKPGLVDDIAPLIKSGHHFNLMAVRRNEGQGFVNVNHDQVYIVLSITVDDKTFLVR